MEFINEPDLIDKHFARVQQLLDLEKRLPEQVFKKPLTHFMLMDSDEVFWGGGLDQFRQFLNSINESSYYLMVIDSHPLHYYKVIFGIYPIVEISPDVNISMYRQRLNKPLTYNGSESLEDEATIVIFYSFKSDWAIYCDREFELAIVSFKEKEQAICFQHSYNSERLFTPQKAISELLTPAYVNVPTGVPIDVRKKLIKNYS